MAEPLEILILCGSLRLESVTHRALEEAAKGAAEAGGVPVWGDGWVTRLPMCGTAPAGDPSVAEFTAAAARASGFLWGSPEYHGTVSGLLKNALDYLTFEHTEGKWVGLVATAGGHQGAGATLITLRTVARSLHLWTPPDQVSVAQAERALSSEGAFTDPAVAAKLWHLGAGLVGAIRRFRDPTLFELPRERPLP